MPRERTCRSSEKLSYSIGMLRWADGHDPTPRGLDRSRNDSQVGRGRARAATGRRGFAVWERVRPAFPRFPPRVPARLGRVPRTPCPPVKAEPDRSPYEPSVRPGPRPGSRVGTRRVPSLPNGQPRDFRHRGCIRSINMSEPACPARCLSRISRGRVCGGVACGEASEPRAAAPPTRLPLPIAACQPHPVAKPRGPPRPRHRTQTRTFMNVEFELVDSEQSVRVRSRSAFHGDGPARPARHRHPRLRRPPRARAPRPPGLSRRSPYVPASRRSALPV